MNTVLRYVGIDVSKAHLDVFVQDLGSFRFDNDRAGLEALQSFLGKGEHVVALEATGSYHVLAAQTLADSGAKVHLYNPRQVRDLAKTDRVDAKVLASCARLVESPFVARSEVGKELREISRHLQSLTRLRSDLKKRLGVPQMCQRVADSLQRQIRALDEEIRMMEAQWMHLLKGSEAHLRRYQLLLSVPRIGLKTARVMLSELPEDLGRFNRKELASYFGLVPFDRQSGSSRARSILLHGNPRLRQPLFCAATSAMTFDAECRTFAQRLKAKGKHHLTVVCAVMHKLARRAIAVLLRDRPWEEQMSLPA
jgi:transposase